MCQNLWCFAEIHLHSNSCLTRVAVMMLLTGGLVFPPRQLLIRVTAYTIELMARGMIREPDERSIIG